jgi:3-phenylpropionate/trans-cinnamate dioxygenase ferredoxin reductase subunit
MIGIVGGGLAAAKCIESYREHGGEDEIVVWSQDPHGPYHRPPLSKRLLRGEAEPADALVHPVEWYAEHGVDLRLGESVSSLDEVKTDTVVIATGARPRALGDALPLRTIDNSLELRRRAETARAAVVVGGGFIGCEVTASLTMVGVKVTQVVRDPMVFAPLQAPPLSAALHETYRANGVDLRLGATEIPESEFVVAGIGVEPNVELARAAGLEVRSGIVVDERFATDRPGVYAIGDVAEFFDPVFRRHRRIEHWSNAAHHGTTLGRILAGDAEARYDIVSAFFSEEFGRTFRMFGDPSGHDGARLDGDFLEGDAVYRILRGGNAIAAVVTGQDEDSENALKDEIRAGAAAAG